MTTENSCARFVQLLTSQPALRVNVHTLKAAFRSGPGNFNQQLLILLGLIAHLRYFESAHVRPSHLEALSTAASATLLQLDITIYPAAAPTLSPFIFNVLRRLRVLSRGVWSTTPLPIQWSLPLLEELVLPANTDARHLLKSFALAKCAPARVFVAEF